MENKADIKAIMARFQSGTSIDESSSTSAGCPKQPLMPTLSSGPVVQKKPVLESLSSSATNVPPKPSYLKNTPSTKSDSDLHVANKTKALASKFANNQDDASVSKSPNFNKQQTPQKPTFLHAGETKNVTQKPLNKPSLSSALSESKPAFPKPPVVNSKPSWVKEDSGGNASTPSSTIPPKAPSLYKKPNSNALKLRQPNEEQVETNADATPKPSPLATAASKPASNFKAAQSLFNKEKETPEQTENGGINKPILTTSNSAAPPRPPNKKKPSLKKTSVVINGDGTAGPKQNPLPNSLALGPPPAKPNRPPKVNLEAFKRGAESSDEGSGFKKSVVPTPPGSHPSNHSNSGTPTPPPQVVVPSLPPRHPGTKSESDVYDDVAEIINAPPPLPPSAAHPSQRAKEENDSDDGEMYEPLDDRWDEAEKTQEKKKDDKEEKKRLEAEKKEQKEREKKENDARKKFKLNGPLGAIQQGKALVDCKGNKMDLSLKQGDSVDIIRVQNNPEGKWLGRTHDGSIGYVKITSVEIDFNSLKNCQIQTSNDSAFCDDIGVGSDNSGIRGPGVVLPPLPGEDEIYHDVDQNLEVRLPPPTQFTAHGNSDDPEAVCDEIYDDVDSQNAPPPPPIGSLPGIKSRSKAEEMDPKKQKKFEKEEKEFRKKFKYDGDIQVLYQVDVRPTLTNKKWSGKDLPLKAGERLDVIDKAVDDKLICRNEDGKFGYVSTSYIAMDDGEIYDDIGGDDDCIYDNE